MFFILKFYVKESKWRLRVISMYTDHWWHNKSVYGLYKEKRISTKGKNFWYVNRIGVTLNTN